MNQWYVAGLAWEIADKPLARTFLNQPVVLFRLVDGKVVALEDRCCHRALPLSFGTVEEGGLRCGYHGLLFDGTGKCIEIPGQPTIPTRACVRRYDVIEKDQIVWIWMSAEGGELPTSEPPSYPWHSDQRYQFKGDAFHYQAPYQLIHDNLMDLSHLGYVHTQTIGGDPKTHMEAEMRVAQQGETVKVTRWMRDSRPPKTYTDAWPFTGQVDRWQEIEFDLTYLKIWTGAADVGTESLDDESRGGFHMRGFHGITPETETSTHYFWTIASNEFSSEYPNLEAVYEQTAHTFMEDKTVVEAQHRSLGRFPSHRNIDIHVDAAANRVKRIVDHLSQQASANA
ncbi:MULTISPECIES: aromatic ring-hydroxylating dioxygenase subunit alpha [Burkholderiaceae]|uniref:aromatic ring-hydroxylating dioxygenase subunit alpha n=1 Tax=Burkholderiaceae TaxID=119060 RepID=UPI0014237B37|nr:MULTISPECIES: aromatic ring-hydroxylating dioxygenase subunit alpha [Burkholderiaceae]MBN3851134.1 aromatic ring-hydroxylating dioxygenase subunit alpha [Paraburkholderia sp. Ac-20342]NIF51254.1 aromatic ring-hydroxylating dioxygenase subunit alpha [Burkholderia sp. Ax-1724]